MKNKNRRHFIEHIILIVCDRLINIIPGGMLRALGGALSLPAQIVFRSRMREAQKRIRTVFGDRFRPKEVQRIARYAGKNITLSSVEILRAHKFSNTWFRHNTNITEVCDRLAPYLAVKRGAVLACAHMGSWEIAAIAGRRFDLPVFAIAAPQKNPYFNDWMISLRRRAGIETLLRDDANLIRKVIRRLKSGRFLAILPDVRAAETGIPISFLGGQARIGPGMALFARMAGVPVIPCLTFRLENGYHRITLTEPLEPDPQLERARDVHRMTQAVMQQFETAIREQPHQWFWFNKRWILDPVAGK